MRILLIDGIRPGWGMLVSYHDQEYDCDQADDYSVASVRCHLYHLVQCFS